MVRIAEYWELWAARLEVEIAAAWRRGDQKTWHSLRQARTRALELAESIRNQPRSDHQYLPVTVTQEFLTSTGTHW